MRQNSYPGSSKKELPPFHARTIILQSMRLVFISKLGLLGCSKMGSLNGNGISRNCWRMFNLITLLSVRCPRGAGRTMRIGRQWRASRGSTWVCRRTHASKSWMPQIACLPPFLPIILTTDSWTIELFSSRLTQNTSRFFHFKTCNFFKLPHSSHEPSSSRHKRVHRSHIY